MRREPAGAGPGVGTGRPRWGHAEGARGGRRLGKREGLAWLGRVGLESGEEEPQEGGPLVLPPVLGAPPWPERTTRSHGDPVLCSQKPHCPVPSCLSFALQDSVEQADEVTLPLGLTTQLNLLVGVCDPQRITVSASRGWNLFERQEWLLLCRVTQQLSSKI